MNFHWFSFFFSVLKEGCFHVCIYIYIYIERERERVNLFGAPWCPGTMIEIYYIPNSNEYETFSNI